MSGWWRDAVVYQVYVRSFADGNGDGGGDLAGVRARLAHLAWLGVDAIWLTPFYPSPMADGGYDVADHCDVDPRFGTLSDFDDLLAHAHELGLRVLVDVVPNHTSDRHPWFAEALRCMTCGSKSRITYTDDCMTCFNCELNCPSGAIYVHPFKERFARTLDQIEADNQ